jgi:hypothetical protein
VKTVADAVRFVTNLSDIDKAGFFKEAAEWKGPVSNDSLGETQQPAAPEAPKPDAPGEPEKPADTDAGEPSGPDKPVEPEPGDDKAISASAGASSKDTRSDAPASGKSTKPISGDAGKTSGKHK